MPDAAPSLGSEIARRMSEAHIPPETELETTDREREAAAALAERIQAKKEVRSMLIAHIRAELGELAAFFREQGIEPNLEVHVLGKRTGPFYTGRLARFKRGPCEMEEVTYIAGSARLWSLESYSDCRGIGLGEDGEPVYWRREGKELFHDGQPSDDAFMTVSSIPLDRPAEEHPALSEWHEKIVEWGMSKFQED